MMGAGDLVSDWKARHPFTLGQYVHAKRAVHGITPLLAHRIYMRGESERGLWIAFEAIAYEFSVDDFEAVDRASDPTTGEAA
jgi:hypothetical protein